MINKTYPIAETILKNGSALSSGLLTLLNDEANYLRHPGNIAVLSKIVAKKTDITSQLEQFTRQLTQVLASEKLPMTPEGVSQYFAKATTADLNTTEAISHWQKIATAGKQCRLINQQNGASINLLSRHTQRSISILQGKSPNPTTYGPNGITHNEQLTHALVSV